MKLPRKIKSPKPSVQHLNASEVSKTVKLSGLSRHDFAAEVGCGTSQIFKYQDEGLPPRMNRLVRANILRKAMELGVIAETSSARAEIQKLAKGRQQKLAMKRITERSPDVEDPIADDVGHRPN